MREKTLYIFSYGLRFSQITLETLSALRKCGVVYTQALDAMTAPTFMKLTPDLKLICGMGKTETVRTVLNGFKSHDTVGFLTYGNPVFINGFTKKISVAAARRKVGVKIFEAVSSIDSLMTLFNLNVETDIRLIDVSRLRRETILTPGIDSMFFSVNQLNSPSLAGKKKLFLSKTAAAYPAGARVYLASCCAGEHGEDNFLSKSSVKKLASLLGKADVKHTLFIPAVSWKR